MTERQLQQAIIECGRRLGFLVFHVTDARRSEPGFPDLIIAGHGHVFAFECKSQKGKLRGPSVTKRGRVLPGQKEWLDAFEQAGEFAAVVRPDATGTDISYDQALELMKAVAEAENDVHAASR